MTTFAELGIAEPLLRALREEAYTTPTPIQVQAIPPVLAGRDVLGCAQTGTGKTAAFALPILQHLAEKPLPGRPVRALVLAPTRELAAQIAESFRAYGRHYRLSSTVVYGGVGLGPQKDALRRGVDILVACPGRLLDLIGQGCVRLDQVQTLVLDEADRMLDMGFIHDIRKIIARLPARRQNLLFSATMPRDIRTLADDILHAPTEVAVAPVASAAETVTQAIFAVAHGDKPALLRHLLDDRAISRVLVFTRTKHGADKVARLLDQSQIRAEAIHGNKSQNARMRALEGFRKGAVRVLVASDIAARGLDIDGITHVVNYDVPNEPETYVHRIGRTGRAGASGTAWSFCSSEERAFVRDIERLIRRPIDVVADHPFAGRSQMARPAAPGGQGRGGYQGGGGQGYGRGRQGGGGHGDRRREHSGQGERRDHGGGEARPAAVAAAGGAAAPRSGPRFAPRRTRGPSW